MQSYTTWNNIVAIYYYKYSWINKSHDIHVKSMRLSSPKSKRVMMWWQWPALIVMLLDWIYQKLWLSNHQRCEQISRFRRLDGHAHVLTYRFSSLPNAKYFSFLSEDFFTWEPGEKFDLIFDYTFFCAFEPSVRPLWAERIEKLLKPSGELITLMFPIDERSGGPPYKVSVSEYEKVLIPLGFEAISIVDNKLAVRPRKGVENIGRWKKRTSTFHSTL